MELPPPPPNRTNLLLVAQQQQQQQQSSSDDYSSAIGGGGGGACGDNEMMASSHPKPPLAITAETASLSDDESERSEDDGLVVVATAAHANKTTELQAFLHLLKGYVGPGCLSLPWAVSQFGHTNAIPLGCAAIAVVALWTSGCGWMVVTLRRQYSTTHHHQQPQSTTSTATTTNMSTTTTYPGLAGWLWGPWAQTALTIAVCVQQLAVCTVFLSFLGTNLQAVLHELGFESATVVNHVTVLTAVLPVVVALSTVSNLKALAPFIGVATGLLFLGLTLLMSLVVLEWAATDTDDGANTNQDNNVTTSAVGSDTGGSSSSSWLAIGAILYSFEGVCLILPVQASMERPQNFAPVFVTAMTSAAVIFALVASLSVAAFGTITSGSITAFLLEHYSSANDSHNEDDHNSSPHPWRMRLVVLANAVVSASVLLTYPLQMFPCLELLVGSGLPRQRDHRRTNRRHNFAPLPIDGSEADEDGRPLDDNNDDENDSPNEEDEQEQLPSFSSTADNNTTTSLHRRVGLVMVTYILAIAVPNVESLISLAGALAGSSVALIVPPLMHICSRYQKQPQQQQDSPFAGAVVLLSYVLVVAGFVFLVIGTKTSLMDIVQSYKGK